MKLASFLKVTFKNLLVMLGARGLGGGFEQTGSFSGRPTVGSCPALTYVKQYAFQKNSSEKQNEHFAT